MARVFVSIEKMSGFDSSTYDLKRQVAIVTGGARGIGQALARGLSEAKARVVIADKSDEVFGVERRIRSLGYDCKAILADVGDRRDVRKMVKKCINKYGRVDIMVNNAAISTPSSFGNLDEANWLETIGVNLTGVFHCCKEVVPYMIEQGGGTIINFSSVNAQFGARETAHYCASKGGVESLSKALARELGAYKIRVNVISPGFVDTPMLDLMPPAQREKLVRRIPLGRLGHPRDFIGPVLFLSSAGSEYITGQTININGGFFMS